MIWGVYFLFLLGPCFFNGNNNILIRIMLLFVFILIKVGISIPPYMKTQISDFVNGLINSLGVVSEDGLTWNLPKARHFFFSYCLAWFFLCFKKMNPILWLLLIYFCLQNLRRLCNYLLRVDRFNSGMLSFI